VAGPVEAPVSRAAHPRKREHAAVSAEAARVTTPRAGPELRIDRKDLYFEKSLSRSIKRRRTFHSRDWMTVATASLRADWVTSMDARVRDAIEAHYKPLWRFLRRMGVEESQVEDATQQVLLVFAQRGDEVAPGLVRSFLFGTALRVASDFRRKRQRTVPVVDLGALREIAHPAPDAEQQTAQGELRQLLDRILDELAPELRAVFVLAELEETTMAEVARVLGIPPGTVASRLRRARELFAEKAHELRPYIEKGLVP
jgi:RNA polymerase sigma-70 factor (ECF subfamily)